MNLVFVVMSIGRDGGSDGSTGGADTRRSSFNTRGDEFQRIGEKAVGGFVATAAAVVAVNLSVALHNKIRNRDGRRRRGRSPEKMDLAVPIGNQDTSTGLMTAVEEVRSPES